MSNRESDGAQQQHGRTNQCADDTEQCQKCEDAPQETAVVATVGGVPAGTLHVCNGCEGEMTE